MVGKLKNKNGKLIENSRIGSTVSLVGEESLNLGENVFIGQFNFIDASNGLKIEEGCQITNFVSILTHSSHKAIRLYGAKYTQVSDKIEYGKGEVRLGKYTFVGPHSVIMPNTDIGKGSIVSAYSFVKGTFPDFSIITGNPAKVIGDTREMDREILNKNPQLNEYYNAWTKEK